MYSETCIRTYAKLEECTVKMSPAMARECKPYKGCPRGPAGVMGFEAGTSAKEMILKQLLAYGDRTLKGQDGDFVCIPQVTYESILRIVEQLEEHPHQ